jgi:hypothetical protein
LKKNGLNSEDDIDVPKRKLISFDNFFLL